MNASHDNLLKPGFSLDPLIAEAKRRARRRRLLLALVAVLIAGGAIGAAFAVRSPNGRGAASATPAFRQISTPAPAVGSDCGMGVPGRGFHVFACMSGGARAGHPHPKELLVVRKDGSVLAYRAFRVGEFALGGGEVVATYNVNLVRVTSSRLVPLLTRTELAKALHIRAMAIMDIDNPKVDSHGNISFVVSVLNLSRSGCQNRLLKLTAGGTIHQIRPFAARRHICS